MFFPSRVHEKRCVVALDFVGFLEIWLLTRLSLKIVPVQRAKFATGLRRAAEVKIDEKAI